MDSFAISTSLAADGTTVLHVRGDIDILTSQELLATLVNEVRRRRPPHLVVDMLHVTFLDSAGVAALLTARRAAQRLGTSLVLRELSAFVTRQLRVAGVYDTLTEDR
ncbi:STAS domain-containing protein [Micromonospora sp. SL1-18]|uniref:STAS domain-containing protein n=1 Tax=Micromonospora sp. SL1-18 TaxID=3399128 RepID=UPI003A4D6CD1